MEAPHQLESSEQLSERARGGHVVDPVSEGGHNRMCPLLTVKVAVEHHLADNVDSQPRGELLQLDQVAEFCMLLQHVVVNGA